MKNYNSSGFGFIPVLLVVAVLAAGGFAVYEIKNRRQANSSVQEVPSTVESETPPTATSEENTPVSQTGNLNPSTSTPNYFQVGSIKILSPTKDQNVEAGSTLVVKYELTEETKYGVILATENCVETIQNKSKGAYSFECKIDSEKLGAGKIGIFDSLSTEPLENSTFSYKVIAPVNAKPTAIVTYPEDPFIGIIGNDSTYIAVSIKYSDGITRDIPFTYLTYFLDDPSLLSWVHLGENYAQHFQGNKGGKTTLHLKYQNLSKDVLINVCGGSSDNPC